MSKHWPHIPETPYLVMQEPMFDTRSNAACRTFWTQRKHVTISIGEGIHFFFYDISDFADMNLDIEDDGRTSEYDLNYTGPVIFLSAGF